jgi:hypothetical protein
MTAMDQDTMVCGFVSRYLCVESSPSNKCFSGFFIFLHALCAIEGSEPSAPRRRWTTTACSIIKYFVSFLVISILRYANSVKYMTCMSPKSHSSSDESSELLQLNLSLSNLNSYIILLRSSVYFSHFLISLIPLQITFLTMANPGQLLTTPSLASMWTPYPLLPLRPCSLVRPLSV